jgi:hypothetical protein
MSASASSCLRSNTTILPPGRSAGGILERVQPAGGGLVHVFFTSGKSYSVDESLYEQLTGLTGQQIAIFRYCGHWGAGAMPE